MVNRIDADAGALSWTYDQRGNRLTQSNRVGSPAVAIAWTYDEADRVKTRTADGVTLNYSYDDDGNLTQIQGPAGTIQATYDRAGRPVSVTPDDGSSITTWTYGQQPSGAPQIIRTDASGSATFNLDDLGREVSATMPAVSPTAFATEYRADGSPSLRVDPNGNTTNFSYDVDGRPLSSVTTSGGITRASVAYTYNRAGMRLSEASTVTGDPANGTASFAYDAVGRLTGYTSPLASSLDQAYGWQKVANRDSLTVGGGTPSSLTYDAADRITTSGYTSDADGRSTGLPGQTLTWDSLGRLTQVKNSSTNAVISAYTYDALDRLRTVARSGTTIRFRYVGLTASVAEVVNDNSGGSILKVANGSGGERLATWTVSTTRYLGTNGHGDVTWLTDSTGAVVATLRYDPWGDVIAASGSSLPDWRFQGSWNDAATGMSWAISRWYAPALGRFVSEDSVLGTTADPSRRHLYVYATGDQVNEWDPNGRDGMSAAFSWHRDQDPEAWYRYPVPEGDQKKFIYEAGSNILCITGSFLALGFLFGVGCSLGTWVVGKVLFPNDDQGVVGGQVIQKKIIRVETWYRKSPFRLEVARKWKYGDDFTAYARDASAVHIDTVWEHVPQHQIVMQWPFSGRSIWNACRDVRSSDDNPSACLPASGSKSWWWANSHDAGSYRTFPTMYYKYWPGDKGPLDG